jgi:hypothetical protein
LKRALGAAAILALAACPLSEAGRFFLCPPGVGADGGYCDVSSHPLVVDAGRGSSSTGSSSTGGSNTGGTSTGGTTGGGSTGSGACAALGVPESTLDQRYALAGIALNSLGNWERVFAVGGIGSGSDGGFTTEVQFEDLETQGAVWQPAGNLSTPRADFPVVNTPFGLLAIGGLGPDGPLTSVEYYNTSDAPGPAIVWATTPAQATVPALLPLPKALYGSGVYGHAAILLDDEITNLTTSLVTCGGIVTGSTVAFCSEITGYAYDAGRDTAGDPNYGFAWFDAGWQELPAQMNHDRAHFSLVTDANGDIYAIGGAGSYKDVATSWERFDGTSWSCPAPCPSLNAPRIDAAATLAACPTGSDECLYVIGGHSQVGIPTGLVTTEYLDLGNVAAGWQLGGDLNFARWGHAAVTLPNGNLRVFGGSNEGCILGVTEDYSISNGSWTPTPGG